MLPSRYRFSKIHSLPSHPPFYGIRRDSDTAVSPLSSCPTLSLFLLPHLKLSFHSALCPDSDINPRPCPLPPMSWSEICRSKNIHPLYPNNRIKKKRNSCSWTRSSSLLFPWAVSRVPENRESLRLLSNLARTRNACNLSCQNVSHALQFRSKHFKSGTLRFYKQTYPNFQITMMIFLCLYLLSAQH